MKLKDYAGRSEELNKETKAVMTAVEQALHDQKKLTHLMVQGKESVVLLIEHHYLVDPKNETEFVFAMAGNKETQQSGWSALNSMATACGPDKPQLLNGMNLRAGFAPQAQLFALQPNEVFLVSKYLGHTVNVNETHYRKRSPEFDRLVGLVLNSLESQELSHKNRGKSLDQMRAEKEKEAGRFASFGLGRPAQTAPATTSAVNNLSTFFSLQPSSRSA